MSNYYTNFNHVYICVGTFTFHTFFKIVNEVSWTLTQFKSDNTKENEWQILLKRNFIKTSNFNEFIHLIFWLLRTMTRESFPSRWHNLWLLLLNHKSQILVTLMGVSLVKKNLKEL